MVQTSDPKPLSASSLYLIMFNLILALGWTILLIQFLHHIIYEDLVKGLYDATYVSLLVFQSLAVFEVVHAAVGIVRSNPLLTFFQVFSRVFLLWAIIFGVSDSRTSLGYPMVLFAWCITEIIRYSFYFLGILNMVPSPLVFLRYTLFIVLYPIGVTGEMLLYVAALPSIEKHRYFSISLPNSINFAFDSYYFILIIMALYIPVFPQLYLHMFAQRKKALQDSKKKKQ